MAIKYSMQGLLIYSAMLFYLCAFAGASPRYKKLCRWLGFIGFGLALIAFVWRWVAVAQVPLQNLFEVFLVMGVLIWPLTVFCRVFLNIDSERFDMLIGAIVLFPAGFIFSDVPAALPPILQSWLFAPHVAVYMLAYIVMAKAAVESSRCLCSGNYESEQAAYKMVRLGFPLLTAGLILGSYWAKRAWGNWWSWDPKETWSLAVWLIFAGYLYFRAVLGQKYMKTNSIWVIAGLLCIIACLTWVNLSKIFAGLHNYAY